MKAFASFLAVALSVVPYVSAHYRFPSLIVNGQTTSPYQYVRQNTNSNSPITDVSSTDIRCNAGGLSGGSTQTANVAAGSTVGFALDQPIFHSGTLNVYMSKAPGSVSSYDGSGGWFKIYQVPPVTNGGSSISFPTDNKSSFTFSIPSSISSGQYLLRIEHIALHSAAALNGAQFYISCAQINVTGGGSTNPPTVSFPGAYTNTDPGLRLNIYYPVPPTYAQPGPPVFSG